jgi:uncharacterized protein
MNATKVTILTVFTILLIFNVVSRIFFNDFQKGWNAYEKKDFKTARELWLPLAEQGEPKAQFFLGFMHDMGFGVPEDDKKALKWYQLSAEQGDSRAQLFTGYIYDFGNGVSEDNQKAFKWYKLALEQGFKQAKKNIYNLAKNKYPEAIKMLVNDGINGEIKAQEFLATMYHYGKGVSQDLKKAVKWYQIAAENEKSKGVRIMDVPVLIWSKNTIYKLAKKNSPDALKILINDAESGETNAQYILARMYESGQGISQDTKKAVKWYHISYDSAAWKTPSPQDSIYNLAKKNSPDALKILLNDAGNGDIYAQTTLSVMYQIGLGVPQDYHESTKWFRFAAEREFSKEKNNTIIFSKKTFRKNNIPQTLKALSNDAESGRVDAQMNLGIMLKLGVVVPKDEKKAAKWFLLAAEQGYSPAQSIMWMIYVKGQGVPQDDQEAMKWHELRMQKMVLSIPKPH